MIKQKYKFKVGDKVKRIKTSLLGIYGIKGNVYEVECVKKYGDEQAIRLKGDKLTGMTASSNFELIESTPLPDELFTI